MRNTWRLVLPLLALFTFRAGPSDAGCGCDKPPPPLAPIRPAFAPPDGTVTLFDPALVDGAQYTVAFGASPAGVVSTTAVSKRDYADGVDKPQLVVTVPDVQPGPTIVAVRRDGHSVFTIPASAFTVLQRPIALGETNLTTIAACYRAAVSTNGTVYFPFDITDVGQEMNFSGAIRGYRFTFDPADIMIYNAQGVLMQLLGPAQASIFSIQDDALVGGALQGAWSPALAVANDPTESFGLAFDPDPAADLATLYARPTTASVTGVAGGGTGLPASNGILVVPASLPPASDDYVALLRSLGSFEHDGAQVTLSVDMKIKGKGWDFLGVSASGGGTASLTLTWSDLHMTLSMNNALDGSIGVPLDSTVIPVVTDWIRMRVTFQYVNGQLAYSGELLDIGPDGISAESTLSTLTGTLSNADIEGNPILLGGFGGTPTSGGAEAKVYFDNFSDSFTDPAASPPTGDPGLDGRNDGVDRQVRSFRLNYDRHQFQTYRAQHALDSNFFLDASDHAWHTDGTRHIDHNRLIVAIHGVVDQQTPPTPGETPPFDLHVTTQLVGNPGTGTPPITVLEGTCDVAPPGGPGGPGVSGPGGGPRPCTAVPQSGCMRPIDHGTRLALRNASDDARDALAWQWRAGQEIAAGGFGNPLLRDGFALCVYDDSNAPTLLLETDTPTGGTCGGRRHERPCWRSLGRQGFLYRSRSRAAGGFERVLLRPGRRGRARIEFAQKGSQLTMPGMPLPLPLRVQLQDQNGSCWEASYSRKGVRTDDARHFKATGN